ncbi:aromatic amino acid ammonia-lyase [Streptomyces radicis]|uniref:Aromatic amino acid lyase n=1 Tax=Streptomyces radicis TaxID=1750517 RepID=A0A3A9W5H9_9ACTN|nr:aromatic amino acid ammonia-lyase [Streptomyces radicis]RKN04514.1 aromatic amino acid lyase [Streptomyces radicis]RKN15492.1 aromatic amino acid lyase [Streptomyces radicis]
MLTETEPATVAGLIAEAAWERRIELTARRRQALAHGRASLTRAVRQRPVYGVSRGFGPLADHPADPDAAVQASGLIDHLTVGQGSPLPPTVARLMVWLRLRGMALGHSGVEPETWEALAAQWNAGFTPVVPREGSLSASGDLIPLAHAAAAAAGRGEAWRRTDGGWRREPAAAALARRGLTPVRWEARSALAFVNGTSAALATALVNHARLLGLAHAAAAATGRLALLLGSDPVPFSDALAAVRGHPGHRTAAALIRRQLTDARPRDPDRPLQEPYSLRCAPQVIGAVIDQLRLQERVLLTEATGCTDNPVLVEGELYHGGNFHAAPVALAAEQHAVCVHQLAYLLERQLALAVDPRRNGGLPPLLAARPGRDSGLAGVQIAATSHLAAIRQRAYPASCTPLPTNLGNQDHVPMALNGANAAAEMLDRAWWVASSLYHALAQIRRLQRLERLWPHTAKGGLWERLAEHTPQLTTDRPMADAVATLAARLEEEFVPRAARPPGGPHR